MIRIASLAVIVGMVGPALPARGQSVPSSWFGDTVTVVAGKKYAKGGVYRFFFGAHYRDLWTTPIRVPVLDLAKFAGGLKPKREGGGQQTKSLRLDGGDGKEYQFRSVDKDPSAVLPLGLRETFADRVFQDQISAGHPAGPLMVPPILEAAGVLHSTPILAVMPDDPTLGKFRGRFAGVLGMIEERPKDSNDDDISFAGAKDIVGTDDLFKKIDKHPLVRVDSREFLLARLTDVFLGDWDRHRDQWRWALLDDHGTGEHWHPIPRDRDQAFVEFDGLLLTLVRGRVPQLVKFNRDYPPIEGATWNGRDLDHRFLADLTRADWDSVAKELQSRITDDVIERAVRQMPPEYQPLNAEFIRRGLKSRRDRLVIIAGRYYRMLAGQVDIIASGQPDLATIAHTEDGLDVTVSLRDNTDRPYYRRHFVSGETSDVRVYLKDGSDSAIVSGDGGGIQVRVIGGADDDAFAKTGGGSAHFYDSEGKNRATGGSIQTKRYQAIDDTTDKTALPHRDWGRDTFVYPVLSYDTDAGVLLGLGTRVIHWGFRKKPYSSEVHFTARIASGSGLGKVTFDARVQNENSRNYWEVVALASGVESLRWYGFGNESVSDPAQPITFYRAAENQIQLSPSIGWLFGDRVRLTLGPRFKYAVTDNGKNLGRFIGIDRPFGSDRFTDLGAGIDLQVDTRDVPTAPRHGVTVDAGAKYVPSIFDVKKPFGEVHGRATTYLSVGIPTRPVLALQVGGQRVFGTKGQIPFHEAAFLGSSTTLRGFQNNRFAGDASLYGNAELRLHLSSLFLIVPGSQGIFGFVDGGRVYYEGEQSNTWHHTFGGGIWMAFLTPGSVLSVAVGKSDDGTRVYLKAGFAY